MTIDIAKANAELRDKPALEIVRWAIAQADGRAIVSTNFRPYEAVILHLCVQVQPDIPVLWVDHGYNRPATYRHAEELRKRLGLNIKPYLPRITAAHRDAVHGPVPTPEDEAALKEFSAVFKIEPFQRGMRELAPSVWITALRKVQNPNRANLDIVSARSEFRRIEGESGVSLVGRGDGSLFEKAQPPQRVGLFRPRQGRREARVRPARRVGRPGSFQVLNHG